MTLTADDLDVEPKAPCCKHRMVGVRNPTPVVQWNQFNGVVQCHACGQIYVPAASDAEGVEAWAGDSPAARKHVEDGTAPA